MLCTQSDFLAGFAGGYTGYSSLVREGVVSFEERSGVAMLWIVDPLGWPPKGIY